MACEPRDTSHAGVLLSALAEREPTEVLAEENLL
jgi:hypothetical protein